MAREQQRHATLADELAHQLEHLGDTDGVDRDRRLVEDQDVGILDQRVGDAQPLPHASRVRVHPGVGPVRQAHLREHVVDLGFGRLATQAVEPRRVAQVLAAGHAPVEARVVGQVADPPLDAEGIAGGIQADH